MGFVIMAFGYSPICFLLSAYILDVLILVTSLSYELVQVFEKLLGSKLYAFGDVVNADLEILGLIIWTAVNLLLPHFIFIYELILNVLRIWLNGRTL